MIKEKLKLIGSFVLKNSKIILPIAVVLVVAVIVSVVLQANDDRIPNETSVTASAENEEETPEPALVQESPEPKPEEAVLEENSDLRPLMCTYYNAYALGDMDTIRSITNYLDETEEIRMKAMSEYVETYPEITVYSKPGPVDGSYLAYVYYKMTVKNFDDAMAGMETFYVCTKEDGTLYLNRGDVSDEELEYIREVNSRDDVVELYNRATVECNDTFLNNADLFYYIQEIMNEVQKATGETLAEQMSSEAESVAESGEGAVEGTTPEGEAPVATEAPAQATEQGPVYAKATTTVNVRVSDSEQADKAGKVSGGTKVEVIEQQVNGWSKIKADDIEGYIKSEYLQLMNTAGITDAVGTVTATSNVNVRSAASETADRLGVLAGGESAELLGRENGWCKINYNGEVGYVKEDFVQ